MKVVEQARLVEDLRLGRVEVLRLAAVERSSAESDERAGLGVNRNDETIAEAVVKARLFFSRRDEPGLLEFLLAMFSGEPSQDVVPRVGRVSESVLGDDFLRYAALLQISRCRVVRKSQRLMKRLGRVIDRFE